MKGYLYASLSILVFAGFHAMAATSGLFYGTKSEEIVKNEFCSLRVTVPQFMSPAHASAELQKFVTSENASWDKEMAALKADYKKNISDNGACKDYSMAYQIDFSFEIKTPLNWKLTSLYYSDYRFTGGAHGGTAVGSETFDNTTGQRYRDLSAFFEESKLPTIKAKILEKLKIDEGFEQTFGWNQWNQKTTGLKEIDNFYLSQEGLVIFYQQYQVGPYAAGIITATLDWGDLQTIGFKPGAPTIFTN